MHKLVLVRSQNVAQKRKSRANMSISKIEEIQKYDRERKQIMRSRNKKQEIGTMPEHLCNSNEITVSSKNVSAAKCEDNHKIKSTPKETIGEILNSSVVKEQSLLDQDGIHVTGCNSEFVTKNIHVTDSENKFVKEKKIKRLVERILIGMDKYHLASRYLQKMVELKKKKNTLELQKIQNEVLEKFSSKREFAIFSAEMERVIYRLFDNKKKEKDESFYRKKIKTSEKEEIRRHSISKDNANVFPTA